VCQRDLAQVLCHLPKFEDPNLLFGYDAVGDAGVYALDKKTALVQTVDILTPIADDPYIFGEIAAANSLSDIYAMGAKPLTALNVVGFPPKLDISILERIIQGGSSKAKEAGAVIVGGHTIKDQELKYGLAVTGIIARDKIISNDKAKAGDKLVLTKPLGTGIISTALKAGLASEEAISKINDSMRQLNREASEVMQEVGVNACTDITGYGLLGHALIMAQASRVGIKVYSTEVPIFQEAHDYARQALFPGGSVANFEYIQPHAQFDPSVSHELRMLLCDAQTSGGLLISVSEEKCEALLEKLHQAGVVIARVIGEVIEKPIGGIWVV